MKNEKCKNIENNFIFDYIDVLGDFAMFRLKNYCGKILINGKIAFIIAAEDINYLDGNFWAVKKRGKWGVVHHNELTKWVIEPSYDYIDDIFDNYFIVGKFHKCGIININNEIILDFLYDEIELASYRDKNKFIAKKNGRTGIIDINGKIIVPFIYDEINCFYNDNITGAVLNGQYGMLDKKGKLITIDKVNLFDMIKACEIEIIRRYNNRQKELNSDINNVKK